MLGRIFGRSMLYLMGWEPLSEQNIMRLTEYERSVYIFSHTSYFDFYIFILYRLAYPEYLDNLFTLVKPQPFRYAGWLLNRVGAIPASRLEDKGSGGVQRIVDILNEKKSFKFMLSPKGTIVRREWRSGYFQIAKLTNSVIRVVGLDYADHNVLISKACDVNDYNLESLQEVLQNTISKIVPLHPEQEVVPITKRYLTSPTACNPPISTLCVATTVIGLLAVVLYVL